MIITFRVNEVDGTLIKLFAEQSNQTVSGFIRKAVFDIIEESYNEVISNLENGRYNE